MKEKLLYFAAGVITCLIFLPRACNKPKPNSEAAEKVVKETLKIDSIVTQKKDSLGWYVPKNQKSSKEPQKELQSGSVDTMISSEEEKPKNEIEIDSNDTYLTFVADTFNFSSGNFIILDTLSQNRIKARKVIADIKELTIEKTIERTIEKPAKPKNQLFVGLMVQASQKDYLKGVGAELLLKTKKDQIWKAAVIYDLNGQMIYQAGRLFKISF